MNQETAVPAEKTIDSACEVDSILLKRNETLAAELGQLRSVADIDKGNLNRLMKLTTTNCVSEALAVVEQWAPLVVTSEIVPQVPRFTVGDIVRLNSGSRLMNVTAVSKDQIKIFWMSDDGATEPAWYPSECFTKVGSVAPSKMTNMDMLKDFAGDVLSYVVAIFIAVKLGITSSPSEPMRPFTVVALLCVFLGFALAKKYFYNRSK